MPITWHYQTDNLNEVYFAFMKFQNYINPVI